MSAVELMEQILAILNKQHIGSMVTVTDDKPHARYMTFTNDRFTLFTMTDATSAKVLDLEKNPYTHILYGYTMEEADAPYLEIEAKLTHIKEDGLKLKMTNLLRGILKNDAGEMITLQIEPVRIRLMNRNGQPPQELNFVTT